ncbi:hypothetical protein Tco_1474986 [Tanacetum coccineum]
MKKLQADSLDKMIAQRMAEEEALTEQQKKRKAQVQFEAQFYTEEDWDTIRAKLEANAELSKDFLVQQIDTFVPINLEATKAKLKIYGEELQTKTSKKQRIDDKMFSYRRKVLYAQEDSKTDKEESVEAMNPTPLTTKSDSVANWKIF